MRHLCGEVNPGDARFCGGCGADLAEGTTCNQCGRTAPPEARFCHGCGAKMDVPSAAAAPHPSRDSRLDALEGEVAVLRGEVEELLVMKAQLDGALQRIRQRNGQAPAAGRSATTKSAAKAIAASPEETAAAEKRGDASSAEPVETSVSIAEPASESAPFTSAQGSKPDRVAVIHFEDRPDLQDVVQATIAPYKVASYHPESTLAEGVPLGLPMVVANLLASGETLTAAANPPLAMKDPRAFIYATDAARGFVLGMTDLFPPPFDPTGCAARILALTPTSPRILVVSEAVLGTPELRGYLVRQGCTTSIAFDEKQALGLIPSVRPTLVLIDLNLPRGEGLRLAGRIRADEHNRGVRIAFMWQQKIDAAAFRQFVTRATLDFRFSEEALRRLLLQEFNPGGAAYIAR